MEGWRSAGLLICILMVLMAYLKQSIPKGKSAYLMKAIISVFILLSIVNGIRNMSWRGLEGLLNRSYAHNEAIWENTASMMEEGLKGEFQRFLDEEKIDALVISVDVVGAAEAFSIEGVIISGMDRELAAKLISSRYQIGLEKIEVVND